MLTDGPLDGLEVGADQSFAILSSAETGGVKFDPTGEIDAMVQRLKQQYPDAQVLSSEVLRTPEGNVGEVRYERTIRKSRVIVGGVHWAKPLGENRAVLLMGQHPRRDEAAFAKLQRIRDGLSEK